MMRIKETIVVEGKDDKAAVLAAVEANVLCTSGYGLNEELLALIEAANQKTGIIVFTDPDHAGRKIRERVLARCPGAKQAFLTRSQAEKDGDIGIENACPEDIVLALEKASAQTLEASGEITRDDLVLLGLAGSADSAAKREAVGKILGIGYANTKTFLKRLNYMGIGRKQLADAVGIFER